MTRTDLIMKIKKRKEMLGITIENLSRLSGVSVRTVNRLLGGEDVKLSTVERITCFLGLDFAGNETMTLEMLKQRRAKEKALLMASMVQGTSSLEMQGLEKESLETMMSEFEEAFLNGDYKDRLWVA